MSRSWNHQIRRQPPQDGLECSTGIRCPGAVAVTRTWGITEAQRRENVYAAKIGAPATYLATYDYVTGRAGRVSYARRNLCEVCARKWAAKHGVDLALV